MTTVASRKLPVVVEAKDLDAYIAGIIHSWSQTLTTLGFTLIPIFFILDYFMMPAHLLPRFALYRMVTTGIVVGQYFVLRFTRPSKRSYLHGYFFSIVVGLMIAAMTTDLGGFNSTYYAGLNLVLIAVNLLLPWEAIHSAVNSVLIIGLYVALNLIVRQDEPMRREILINNLYFLLGTAVIAVSINHVKQKLIRQEFELRTDLKTARDALWGEMEVAKHIQTALLPKVHQLDGYRVAASMIPASEVGGDYYDLIHTGAGEVWLTIGDVSGHGVESGLIMMMTQTSLFTAINRAPGQKPSDVLTEVNAVIKKNITRLGTDRYMTCSALQLRHDSFLFSGRHQDILVYRASTGSAEFVPSDGVWLGLLDDVHGKMSDGTHAVDEGDLIVVYTDGVTEAMNGRHELFGEERLRQALIRHAHLDVESIVGNVIREVTEFMDEQRDDLTLVVVKRASALSQGVVAS